MMTATMEKNSSLYQTPSAGLRHPFWRKVLESDAGSVSLYNYYLCEKTAKYRKEGELLKVCHWGRGGGE